MSTLVGTINWGRCKLRTLERVVESWFNKLLLREHDNVCMKWKLECRKQRSSENNERRSETPVFGKRTTKSFFSIGYMCYAYPHFVFVVKAVCNHMGLTFVSIKISNGPSCFQYILSVYRFQNIMYDRFQSIWNRLISKLLYRSWSHIWCLGQGCIGVLFEKK